MCGISGLIGIGLTEPELLLNGKKMSDALTHRGPDSSGIWCDPNLSLVLAHRRLAILDLSPLGHQPMESASNRFVIVFNGEIYNYKDIQDRLKKLGHSFLGHSDTEVLLAAIDEWGLDQTLSECKGMFAFALFDRLNSSLTLVRDRIGEKPLYYGVNNGRLIFGSELKALLAVISGGKPDIDRSALASYLRYGYVSAPYSIYKDIKKLEPGSYLKIDVKAFPFHLDQLQTYQYWNLDSISKSNVNALVVDARTAKTRLDNLLNQIISEQSIADVPLGAFLSGGIDSSVVAGVLQAQSNIAIDTFTIGFHEKAFDEAIHARDVAKHIGSSHHELYINSSDTLNTVPLLAELYDEPFSDASQIPMFLVSKLAKQHVTVCLSGDGGDELFGGYNRYLYTKNAIDRGNAIPGPIKYLLAKGITGISPQSWDHLYNRFNSLSGRKGGANTGMKLHKLAALMQMDNYADAYKYLCSYWQSTAALLTGSVNEPDLMSGFECEGDFLTSAMLWDQKWYLPGDNLVKTDRASMGVSLEMRVPLLDSRLIEFSWEVDNSLKIKDGVSKWILRQVLYDYVPKSLIERPKMGFSVPISHWLRHELKDWAEELLEENFLISQNIFNHKMVAQVFREHKAGSHDHGNKLWTMLMFQAWYKRNI